MLGLWTSSSTCPLRTNLGRFVGLGVILFVPYPVEGVSPNIFRGMLSGKGDPVFKTLAYDFLEGDDRDPGSDSSGMERE